MKKEKLHNQSVDCDEGFTPGQAYPSCEGEPCANMADTESTDTDTMAATPVADPSVEIAQWQDKLLRLQAEFDNYRKRTLREKMDLVQSGGNDVLRAMLPVLDDVQRAIEAGEKCEDVKILRDGMILIGQKFAETFRLRNVVEIQAKGTDFDTDKYEAVAKIPAGEENKGKVVEVIQRGYMLGEKVLRYAKVIVGE